MSNDYDWSDWIKDILTMDEENEWNVIFNLVNGQVLSISSKDSFSFDYDVLILSKQGSRINQNTFVRYDSIISFTKEELIE